VRFRDRFAWLLGQRSEPATNAAEGESTPANVATATEPPSISLSELLSAFSDAAFRSTEAVRAQHLSDMEELYDKSSDSSGDVFKPKTIRLGVTPFVLPAEGEPPPLEVPIAAMMQSNPLMVDEINFEMDCVVLGARKESPADELNPSEIEIGFGGPRSPGCPLRLSIRYKSGEPPHAKARIGDALIRGVQ
jgi:hypothetical protein